MIRLAETGEATLVHRVMLAAFEEYRHLEVPSSALHEQSDGIAEALRTGSEQAILYEQAGVPVGACRFRIEDDGLYLFRLSVSPAFRGRGIGSGMIRWIERYASERGLDEVRCRVRQSVARNIDLYQALGYAITAEEVVLNPRGLKVSTVTVNHLGLKAGACENKLLG